MKTRFLTAIVVAIVQSGCVSLPPDNELVDAGPARSVHVDVDPSDIVELTVGSGDVSIVGEDTDTISGTLEIRCPRDSQSCERWAREAQLVPTRDREHVRIAMNKGAKTGVAVRVKLVVPRDLPLTVKMGYGDLQARGLENDLSITMKAGAIKVEMPEEFVDRVRMAARFGDASMRVGGRYLEGRRAVLVGAKLDWQEGPGTHAVDIAVRFGDAEVELY